MTVAECLTAGLIIIQEKGILHKLVDDIEKQKLYTTKHPLNARGTIFDQLILLQVSIVTNIFYIMV